MKIFWRVSIMILCSILWLYPAPLYAVDDPSELLPNPQQEQQAERIGQQLRCLVCQNESIEESSAPLARDLRKIVREHVAQGEQQKDILAWMTQRYGDFIRLKPVFNGETALLWLMPFLAFGGAFMLACRLWRRAPNSARLSAHEDHSRLHDVVKKD